MTERGPHAIPGTALPTWIIRYDEKGVCTSPETSDDLIKWLASPEAPTHIILMSHGWNSDFSDAIRQYQAFLSAFADVLAAHPAPTTAQPAFVGVTWPSVWFPIDRGPALAAGADAPVGDEVVRAITSESSDEDKRRFRKLVSVPRMTRLQLEEASRIALPSLLPGIVGDVGSGGPALNVEDIVAAAAAVQEARDGSSSVTRPGTFDPTRLGGVRVAGDLAVLDPRNLLRLLSLYQMKDRAGLVGSRGVADLLERLLATKLPVHLVGHSFGARVILSALCTPAALERPAESALLLQPAMSHLAFADTVPGREGSGGYRRALDTDRLVSPLLATFSNSDFPLHDVFHLALRRAADLGEARIAPAGEPPSLYAALGGYGPRRANQTLANIQRPGLPYQLEPGHRIVGLDGSAPIDYPAATAEARIACHGCVANPYTAWALHQQMFQMA